MLREFRRFGGALAMLATLAAVRSAAAQQQDVAFRDNGQRLNVLAGRAAVAGDFNGDGAADVFVSNDGGPDGSGNRVYLGDGRGQFRDSGQRLPDSLSGGMRLIRADVDGDGADEILVGGTIWKHDARAHFAARTGGFAAGSTVFPAGFADLTGDGWPDLFASVIAADSAARGRVLVNQGDGQFRDSGQRLGRAVVVEAALGDLDGDGDVDALIGGWRNSPEDEVPNRVLLNDGSGGFSENGEFFDEGDRHVHALALADVDRDGDLDALLGTTSAPYVTIYLNRGDGRFDRPGRAYGAAGVERMAIADLDGDGDLDMFLACHGPGQVWLNDGRGDFRDSGVRLGNEWSWGLALADFNGDRQLDAFVTNAVFESQNGSAVTRGRAAEVWLNTTAVARPRADAEDRAVPAVTAARLDGSIQLDGRLNDAAWQAAPPARDFLQQEPDEARPAVQRTEVRFLVDGEALYIGARLFDTEGAAGVRGRLVRRDQQEDGDYLALVFDTFHDHAGRTWLQVNPAGSRGDAGQASTILDASWDPVWEAATQVDSLGWTAELRVPLAQLRFPADSLQTWGLQIWRYQERTQETSMWAFWKREDPGGPPRFGHLEGLRFGSRAAAVEVLPYVVSRAAYARPTQAGSPYQHERDYRWRAGADLKALLGPTLTLDATVNPDFGQVEADPAEVNLSAYESYFPERRPFFVEGSGLFEFGGFNCFWCNTSSMSLFYSRRIGRPPRGGPPADAQFAEQPPNTDILGAAKLTGRNAAGLQIGVLDAVTAATDLRYTTSDGRSGARQVEPFTNYFVGRLRQNLRDGSVRLGAMATSVVRRLDDPALAELLPAHAEALGSDWDVTWHAQRYRFTGNLAFTNVSGSAAAITALQRSSARYFQRPDREGHGNGLLTNAYDTTATALRGLGGLARIAREQGKLQWEAAVNFRTPGFETNDLAYLTNSDFVWTGVNVMGYFSQPTRWYRSLTLLGGAEQQHNFDGDRTFASLHAYAGGQLPNYWNLGLDASIVPNLLDDGTTRGGPVVRVSGYRMVNFNVTTDGRRRVQLGFRPNWGVGNDSLEFWNLRGSVRVRLASNLIASVNPYFGSFGRKHQFIRADADPDATTFYGRRVVIAEVRQRQLGLETRLSATFTPDLTLELYAQPFVGAAHYSNFKEYLRPRSMETRLFDDQQQFGNPDFNYRSLRGNAVLRWEWRPGSTLYLVWQQDRSGYQPFGDFALDRDVSGIFDSHADNTFQVKLSYWLNR